MRDRPLIEHDPVTETVLAHLRAELGGDLRVGDHERPPGLDALPELERTPYHVLRRVDGGGWSGPPLVGGGDVELVYQVSSVGDSRKGAEVAAARARRALIGLLPAGAPGRPLRDVRDHEAQVVARIIRCEPDGSPMAPDDEGTLFTVPDRYRMVVTPA